MSGAPTHYALSLLPLEVFRENVDPRKLSSANRLSRLAWVKQRQLLKPMEESSCSWIKISAVIQPRTRALRATVSADCEASES